MGAMFRSELMTQCDLYLQPESAYETLSELGESGIVQFNDMNPDLNAFQRNYVNEVMRCAEVERKLRYLESEMKKDKIEIAELTKLPRAPPIGELLIYEGVIEQWQNEIEEMTQNETTLKKSYLELNEIFYMLTKVGPILGDSEGRRESLSRINRIMGLGGQLSILTGLVRRSKSFSFEMMLWRMAHSNVYYRQADRDEVFEDPQTGEDIRKVGFLIVCQGPHLEARMKKVCAGFRANLYPCPYSVEERDELIAQVSERLLDLNKVMVNTKSTRSKALNTVSKQWMNWRVIIKKMKAIYHTMNLFNVDVTKKVLIGQCWVPTRDLPVVRNILEESTRASMSHMTSFLSKVETNEIPPTFNRTNKFTKGFQALITAYGDATYRELNPALYTIITFPFLFALMFGDMGHAFIVVMFAVWMVVYENDLEPGSKKNEVWGIFFGGRYILLLMGIFSVYTGFIYNDVFSKSMNILGSHWFNTFKGNVLMEYHSLTLDPKTATTDELYFIGVDPVWNIAKNKILFENSMKMKFSIIIGVTHMMFGVCLSVVNYNYFRTRYSIFLEFLPQILFLALLFFYLVFMIFFKWFKYSGEEKDVKKHAGCAPLVLLLFIDMMLFSDSVAVEEGCPIYMYEGQDKIQKVLVITALCCIPVMLFGKPFYLYFTTMRHSSRSSKQSKKKGRKSKTDFRRWTKGDSERKLSDRKMSIEPQHDEHGFSDVMIHQAVHTIEYVLSTISHTASYLRLWALSLAHSQLSEMLWSMVLSKNGLMHYEPSGAIWLVGSFAAWAVFTISILVIMEGLSAFLHTLRLHWVEFMSKFYMGQGYPFRPFCFNLILEGDDKEEKPS